MNYRSDYFEIEYAHNPFREIFATRYDDAPDFAERLLVPLLTSGHDIHMVSAFIPSYVYRLFRFLNTSHTAPTGMLRITLYVPFDLSVKSKSLIRLAQYFEEFHAHEDHVHEFTRDGLELFENDTISISFAHSESKRQLARGCAILAIDGVTRADYVSLVDSKGGDWNSPLLPQRSWVEHEHDKATSVLDSIVSFTQGQRKNIRLINGHASKELVSSIAEALDSRSVSREKTALNAQSDNTGDSEYIDDEFLDLSLENYFFELDELGHIVPTTEEDSLEEDFSELQRIEELLELSEGLRTEVNYSDIVDGHAPPLPIYLSNYYPVLYATCPCGLVFNRAEGCPDFRE